MPPELTELGLGLMLTNGIDPAPPAVNPIRRRFETVRAAVRTVARGNATIAMISGEHGIGKTETIIQELKNHGVRFMHTSAPNVFAFRNALWEANRSHYAVLIIDDSDVLLTDERTANLAKMAFETPHIVILDTVKSQECSRDDANIAPPRFKNTTRLIWL